MPPPEKPFMGICLGIIHVNPIAIFIFRAYEIEGICEKINIRITKSPADQHVEVGKGSDEENGSDGGTDSV